MPYRFLSNSKKAWQAMFQAIESASESVYLEMYIFEDNIQDFDFFELLKEKAREGVRVRVVLDYFGSFGLSKDSISELRMAGVELFFLSYFFHRTHRKILIVDEATAFIGGVNLSQRFKLWNDLVVEIKGQKLMQHIIRSFAKVYKESGGSDPKVISQHKPIILDKTRTWLIEHFPVRKKGSLKRIYKEHMGQAKENITLVTPYFMPKRWFIAALHQAALRGIEVEVLVPKKTDHFLLDRVGSFFMLKLSRLGVKFYLQPKMNHAKVMVIDSREGTVGSNNLDFLSFELNYEVGIFLKEPKAVEELVLITKKWKKDTVIFDPASYKPKLLDYILSPIFSLFTRIF